MPPADVEETDDACSLELELPGVARDDVGVQLDDRVLSVSLQDGVLTVRVPKAEHNRRRRIATTG